MCVCVCENERESPPFHPEPCGVQRATSELWGPPPRWRLQMVGVPVFLPPSFSDYVRDETPDTPGAPTAATARTHTHTHTNVCMTKENTNSRNIVCFHQRQTHARPQRHTRTHIDTHTLVLFLSAFSSDISSSFSSSCSRHMFSSFVRVANSYTTNTHTQHPYRG